MKKKIIISFTIVFIIVCSIVIKFNSKKTFKKDGIIYALTLDGKLTKSIPAKGAYKVNVDCANGVGKWDYDKWQLNVSNIVGNASCDIDFTTSTTTLLYNYIVSLAGTNQGTGKVIHETFTDGGTTYDTGYRYEGKNPNNYVWFNNELWRIIGVFDESSHGKTGKQLVKIIRADSIGILAWDKSSRNNWSTSSLKSLLNGAYLNHEDGTTTEYCYSYASTKKGECDYRVKGIQDGYRGIIEDDVIWYLTEIEGIQKASDVYKFERNQTTTTGTVGLMYISDYGYSVLADTCDRTKKLGGNSAEYNNENCGGSSWMIGQSFEWTIASDSMLAYGQFIRDNGKVDHTLMFAGMNVRPVLYLRDSVKVYDGDGSILNPYQIGG